MKHFRSNDRVLDTFVCSWRHLAAPGDYLEVGDFLEVLETSWRSWRLLKIPETSRASPQITRGCWGPLETTGRLDTPVGGSGCPADGRDCCPGSGRRRQQALMMLLQSPPLPNRPAAPARRCN